MPTPPSLALLRAPYIVNLLMLVPVTLLMAARPDGGMSSVFAMPGVEGTPVLRMLVFSFWLAIAAGSLWGLQDPPRWQPMMILQILYKLVWLLAFALPAAIAGRPWSPGIAASFIVIIALHSFVLWRSKAAAKGGA